MSFVADDALVKKVAQAIAIQQLGGQTRWRWFEPAARRAISVMISEGCSFPLPPPPEKD